MTDSRRVTWTAFAILAMFIILDTFRICFTIKLQTLEVVFGMHLYQPNYIPATPMSKSLNESKVSPCEGGRGDFPYVSVTHDLCGS